MKKVFSYSFGLWIMGLILGIVLYLAVISAFDLYQSPARLVNTLAKGTVSLTTQIILTLPIIYFVQKADTTLLRKSLIIGASAIVLWLFIHLLLKWTELITFDSALDRPGEAAHFLDHLLYTSGYLAGEFIGIFVYRWKLFYQPSEFQSTIDQIGKN